MGERAFELDRYTVLANTARSLTQPQVDVANPHARRVGAFLVFDPQGELVAVREDAAPHLREDFVVHAGDGAARAILVAAPEPAPAGRLRYAVRDAATGAAVGRLEARRRPGLLARRWRVTDAGGATVAALADRTVGLRLARRLRLGRVREQFRLDPAGGGPPAFLLREPEPAPYVLRVILPDRFPVDRRLVLACALVVPPLEGLTQYLQPALARRAIV